EDANARCFPSGENSGRDSVAGCDTSSRASPPRAGTSQMSPPLTNAIVEPSGEMPGSAKDGSDAAAALRGACAPAGLKACATKTVTTATETNSSFLITPPSATLTASAKATAVRRTFGEDGKRRPTARPAEAFALLICPP